MLQVNVTTLYGFDIVSSRLLEKAHREQQSPLYHHWKKRSHFLLPSTRLHNEFIEERYERELKIGRPGLGSIARKTGSQASAEQDHHELARSSQTQGTRSESLARTPKIVNVVLHNTRIRLVRTPNIPGFSLLQLV